MSFREDLKILCGEAAQGRDLQSAFRGPLLPSFGLLPGAGATYVHQDVNRDDLSGLPEGSDDFVVVDAAIGYRLPSRLGIVSLFVSNLFDQGFDPRAGCKAY